MKVVVDDERRQADLIDEFATRRLEGSAKKCGYKLDETRDLIKKHEVVVRFVKRKGMKNRKALL